MLFSKSIPISKSSFDHKKSIAKTQGEIQRNHQGETLDKEQRKIGTTNQRPEQEIPTGKRKPQHQRARKCNGDLTWSKAYTRAPHTADRCGDALQKLVRLGGRTPEEEESAICTTTFSLLLTILVLIALTSALLLATDGLLSAAASTACSVPCRLVLLGDLHCCAG
jgi:hypothetical protein